MPDAILGVVIDPSGAQSGARSVRRSIQDIQRDAEKLQSTMRKVAQVDWDKSSFGDLKNAAKLLSQELGAAKGQFGIFGKGASLGQWEILKTQLQDIKAGFIDTNKELKTFYAENKGKGIAGLSPAQLKNELKILGDEMKETGKGIDGLIKQVDREMKAAERSARSVGSVVDEVWSRLKRLAISIGAGFLAKGFIHAAAEAEQYRQRLAIVMKDQEAANKAFERVRNWASENPIDTDDAIQAFVMLRSAAVSNSEDALKTIANLSMVMGRSMLDVSRAVVSTNTIQLRRLGIQIQRSGDEAIIQSGNVAKKVKGDLASIRRAILEVASENYAGGMDKMANTWGGVMRTLVGMWRRFQQDIMGASGDGGPFDTIRLAIIRIRDVWADWTRSKGYKEFISDVQRMISGGLKTAINGLSSTVKFLAEHFEALKSTIQALLLYKVATWITGITTALSTLKLTLGAPGGGVVSLIAGLSLGLIEAQKWFDSLAGKVSRSREEIELWNEATKIATERAMSMGNGSEWVYNSWGSTTGNVHPHAVTQSDLDAAQKRVDKRKQLREDMRKAEEMDAAKLRSQTMKLPGAAQNIPPTLSFTGRKSKGKSPVEIFVESVRDHMKYLNVDGENFLAQIEKMQSKLKPLTSDWKLLEDLKSSIKGDALNKTLQGMQDQIKYLGKDGAEFLPTLDKMLEGLDRMSEPAKKIQDVREQIQGLVDSAKEKRWSDAAWEFSQGLLKSGEYIEMLQSEISKLTRGTEEWKARFSELQGLKSNEASKLIDSLTRQYEHGTLRSAEYEAALVGIIDRYQEFPLAVQTAIDALQRFREEGELSIVSTSQHIASELKNVTKEFKELEGKGIVGAVDGFLRAAISGEDFGASLRKLGEDILYTTLKMIILQQIMNMFGLGGGGGFGGLSFIGGGGAAHGVPGLGGFAFAKGGVIDGGTPLKRFAAGGVFTSPTYFPMRGGMGLMAEQGRPEGIFPLTRMPNGDLGVKAASQGHEVTTPNVTVHVENKTGAPIKAEQTGVSFDDQAKNLIVSVLLEDQATNGPITRNFRGR